MKSISRFRRLFIAGIAVALVAAALAGTQFGSKPVAAQVTTAATAKDVVTFECFNGQAYFSSRSANAPGLNSSSCAQVTADLLNAGFKLRPTNTVNFGTLFVLVRGTE